MQDDPSDHPTRDPGPTRSETISGSADSSRRQPRFLGDFELLKEIGRGGMGVVYEARQISLNRRVALKVLPPGLGLTGQAVQRFEREARAAANLHHTNIVPVHAIGEQDGHHFYAMELIEGQSLGRILNDLRGGHANVLMDETRTMMQPQEELSGSGHAQSTPSKSETGGRQWFDTVAELLSGVADALDYAHGRGVIHRDIKPANLLLSREGRASVADFGLARLTQEPGMTVSGSFLGTPAYMSPEQIAAGRMPLDHRTDIYSLGVVLYEMLTLQRPFPGQSREEVVNRILTTDPKSPRRINGRIPVDLETICQKAMDKDPGRRYQRAAELASDLRQYLQRELIAARRASLARRAWKSVRRHPVITTATVGVIIVAALAVIAGREWTGRQKADISSLVSDARLQVNRGEFREALEGVEKILSAEPGNIDALLIRARIHFQEYRPVDCVNDAREVLRQDPENWEANMLTAAAAGRGSLYSVSVEEHRRMAEDRAPDSADASHLRGLLAYFSWGAEQDRGDGRDAIRWLTEALEKDPGHSHALERRSDAYLSFKDFPAALADAERLIVAIPESAIGYGQKSWVLREMHDEEGALRAANRAIERDPQSAHGYWYRSRVHLTRGNRSAAIDDLSRAIELDPRPPRLWQYRGRTYRGAGRYDEAVADLKRCIEINPDAALCYQQLFWAHWYAGSRDEAVGVLDEVETRARQWTSVQGKRYSPLMRLWYYRQIGDFERAEEEADRLIELLPHKILGYEKRAEIRRRMEGEAGVEEDCDLLASLNLDLPGGLLSRANLMRGLCDRESAALADYGSVIEMAPAWADPLVDRATLHRNKRRYEEALADLDRAIELAPSWSSPYYNRGLTFAATERFEDALADYERCVELGMNAGNLRHRQAEALVRLGRDEDALQAMQAYINENPESDMAWLRRAILLFEMGRVNEAIEALDRGLEVNPGSATSKAFRAFYAAFEPDACGESAALFEDYASHEAGHPNTWLNIALLHFAAFYYTCPEHYDPDTALEFAEKAANVDSENEAWQIGYARALYRHGRYEEALKVLNRVAGFVARANSDLLFFLSMTHARLGHASEARSYYDRAVARMEDERDRRPDTRFFRQEAADLLGIEL